MLKWLGTLNNLLVIRQSLSRLLIKNYKKGFLKYRQKISSLIGIEFDNEPVYGDSEPA